MIAVIASVLTVLSAILIIGAIQQLALMIQESRGIVAQLATWGNEIQQRIDKKIEEVLRMYIKDLMGAADAYAYAFLIAERRPLGVAAGQPQVRLVVTPTYESAVQAIQAQFAAEGYPPDSMIIERWTSAPFPSKKRIQHAIDRIRTPRDAYVYDLTLLRDRYAIGDEKKVIDSIIGRVQTEEQKQSKP